MSKIYIATKPVLFLGTFDTSYDHLYLVYDPDNDPTNGNELIIRGGPGATTPDNPGDIFSTNTLTFGNIAYEIGLSISTSHDKLDGDNPVDDRHYTKLSLNGMNVENVWAVMKAHAQALQNAALTYELEHDGLTITGGQNSNSVVASIITETLSTGSMFGHLPDDYGSDYPGLETSLVSAPVGGYRINGFIYKLGDSLGNTITGTSSSEKYVLDGGDGIDTLTGNDRDDRIFGGDGGDTIIGGKGNDYIDLGAGDGDIDIVDAGSGNNIIVGAGAEDALAIDGADQGASFIDASVSAGGGVGEIVLTGVADRNDVHLAQQGQDLLIWEDPASGPDRLIALVHNYFNGGSNLVEIAITDSVTTRTIDTTVPTSLTIDQPPTLNISALQAAMAGQMNVMRRVYDPLVLDLDGDSDSNSHDIDMVAGGGTHYFDLNGDGLAESVGWVSSGDGILVRDLNSNGRIDDGSELFGTANTSGFDVLSTLDSNHDGVINSSDTDWSDLQVWIDANSDAQTQDGELHSLSSLDITEFNLTPTGSGYSTAGGGISQVGEFTMDSVTREMGNAFFTQGTQSSVFRGDYTLDPEAVALPQLRGGTLYIESLAANAANGNSSERLRLRCA